MSLLTILTTGSREWRDTITISTALMWATNGLNPSTVLVVHGGQVSRDSQTGELYGADYLVGWVAAALGLQVKEIPAKWNNPCLPACRPGHRRGSGSRSYCPAAGNHRNQEMVDFVVERRQLGPVVCLSFPLESSRGTWDCMDRAGKAGIHVENFGFQKGKEVRIG